MGLDKKMKPLARLIAEQDQLRRRAQDLGYQHQELQERIKRLEHEYTQAWGRAMRSGEEAPDDEHIKQARARLEEVGKETQAMRYAGELADAELRRTVAENASAWDAEVQARGEKILAEAQGMAAALSAKLAETEGLAALHGWLRSGARSYTPPTPATVTIGDLVHERARELGLASQDVEVLG
jgi:hypothetical protein